MMLNKTCFIRKQPFCPSLNIPNFSQTAFHVGRPEYVRRELGKIPWHTKECPPCLGILVTENPLDR